MNIMINCCFIGEYMYISRKQFDILDILANSNESLSQRDIKEKCVHSLGTVNKIVKELNDLGLMKDGKITKEGLISLEPYRAKRAVFIAAGFGSRLAPITLNTPKPLVRVKGTRIIDTLLDVLKQILLKYILFEDISQNSSINFYISIQ